LSAPPLIVLDAACSREYDNSAPGRVRDPVIPLGFKGGRAYGIDLIGDYRCDKRYAYSVETY
jgi:hypothetical protein